MSREVNFSTFPSGRVEPCPKCQNASHFVVHSSQFSEDCCEVWISCVCGFDPTDEHPGERFETVWGGTGNGNALCALDCWNDSVAEHYGASANGKATP